jgi:hypothetical protein
MRFSQIVKQVSMARGWSRELWLCGISLFIGFALMPAIIFFIGSSLLGRYEGASLLRMYSSLYGALEAGSVASWIVLLGPYCLYLTYRALQLWWRASEKLA